MSSGEKVVFPADFKDFSGNYFQMVFYPMIVEPDDTVVVIFQPSGTGGVVFLLPGVDSPVEFDHQPSFIAIKINDKIPDWVLPSELVAA